VAPIFLGHPVRVYALHVTKDRVASRKRAPIISDVR